MSMPGYREQYDDGWFNRLNEGLPCDNPMWDDWQVGECDAEYDQWLYENEPQGNYGLTEDDMMLIVLDMLAFDWD